VDKVISYQQLIKQSLSDLAALVNGQHSASRPNLDCECVFDDEHGHYLLVKIGWIGSRRVRATTAHLRIRDGKIWIEEDMTEEGLASELMAQGVPKEDIVLAFHAPEMRKHTEFAVA
jgi:hypothetical protein